MDILLTGASGFVGRHLAVALAKEHRVIPLNRRPTGAEGEIIHDFAQPLTLDRLPRRVDLIIHTAGLVGLQASSSPLCWRVNVDATVELGDYAIRAHAKKFILFSTGGVYRPTEQHLTEQSVVGPPDAYTQSKLAAEMASQSFKEDFDVQILRLFFPFGPTQRGRLIPNLIQRVSRNEPIHLTNEIGQPFVTPLYIDDLVEYVRRVLLVSESFVANLAGQEAASIRVIADLIAGVLNRAVRFEIKDGMPICNWWGDNNLISHLTDYSPRVSLELGLKQTIAEMEV